MIVTLHDRVFKKSNSDRGELCACVNTLLTLQTMASIKCQYDADNGKHARKSRNHHLEKRPSQPTTC